MAAAGGHLSLTRLLLEAGGQVEDPSAPQYRGCPTPAMTAALHSQDNVLQLLLSSGAKYDKVTLTSCPLILLSPRGRDQVRDLHKDTFIGGNKDNGWERMNLLWDHVVDIASSLIA